MAIAAIAMMSAISEAGNISVQTNKTIEGRAPGLALYGESTPVTSVDDLLSFIIIDEGETKIKPTTQGAITIDGMKTFATQVKTLLADRVGEADLFTTQVTELRVIDVDGDSNPANRQSEIKGRVMVQWLDKEDNPLQASELIKNPSICRAPYKLKIAVTDAQARTVYGTPNSSDRWTGTKIYPIQIKNIQPDFCYATPAVIPSSSTVDHTVWQNNKGFIAKADGDKNFPTTGFTNAAFSLVLVGAAPTDYTWEATVDSGNLRVTVSPELRVTIHGLACGTRCPFQESSVTIQSTDETIKYQFKVSKFYYVHKYHWLDPTQKLLNYCTAHNTSIGDGWSTGDWVVMPEATILPNNVPNDSRELLRYYLPRTLGRYQGWGLFTEWGETLIRSFNPPNTDLRVPTPYGKLTTLLMPRDGPYHPVDDRLGSYQTVTVWGVYLQGTQYFSGYAHMYNRRLRDHSAGVKDDPWGYIMRDQGQYEQMKGGREKINAFPYAVFCESK